MEGVELGSIDDCIVVLYQNVAACLERVEHHSSSVAQLDLKDRVVILAPPLLAGGSMVFTELQKVAEDWNCSWHFRNALDVANICAISPL
jgi:hypothetical protein